MKTSKTNILSEETQSATPFFMRQGGEHSFFHTAIQPKPFAAEQEGTHEEEALAGTARESLPEPVKSFSGATPPGNNIAVQKKCAECEEEETKEKEGPAVQRKEESTATPPADPVAQPVPVVTPAAVVPQARFIVEDGETTAEGQMSKSEFLAKLQSAVCNSVNEALAGTSFTADNCPYLQASFDKHRGSSPGQVEALIQRYAPGTINAISAEGLIQSMKARVYSAALQWVMNGGDLPDPMSTFGNIATGISSTIGNITTGIGNMFFKADVGGAKVTQSPQAVMHSLGKGRPMESSTQSKMEGAFGTSFSNVEIHTDNKAEQLSAGMNARAFTVGNHIAFANGEHQPGNIVGDALLAHELAHTVQQSGAGEKDMQMKSGAAESELESAADESAVSAVLKMHKGEYPVAGSGRSLKSGLKLQRCIDCGGKKDPVAEKLRELSETTDPDRLTDALKDMSDEELGKIKALPNKTPLLTEAIKWEQAFRKKQWSELLKLHRSGNAELYKGYNQRVLDIITEGKTNITITGTPAFTEYIAEQLHSIMGLPTGFRLIIELLITKQPVKLEETKGADVTTPVMGEDDGDAGRMVTTDDKGKTLPPGKQHAGKPTGSVISINQENAENNSVLSGSAGKLTTIPLEPDLTVAHELIHALHNAQGTNIRPPALANIAHALGKSNYLVKDDATGASVNPEELRTISGQTKFNAPIEGVTDKADWPLEFDLKDQITENQLRKEKGLPLRAGHVGTVTSVPGKMKKGQTVDQLLSTYQLKGGQNVPDTIKAAIKSLFRELNPYFSGHETLPEGYNDDITVRLPHTDFVSMHIRFRLNNPADADIAANLIIK